MPKPKLTPVVLAAPAAAQQKPTLTPYEQSLIDAGKPPRPDVADLIQRVANIASRQYSDHALVSVRVLLDCIDCGGGCDRPFEEWLLKVTYGHAWHPYTPDDVAESLDEFRSDFECMRLDATHFMRQYGERLAKEEADAKAH